MNWLKNREFIKKQLLIPASLAILLLSVAFAESKQNKLRCEKIRVLIDSIDGHHFINRQNVMASLFENDRSILGLELSALNFSHLESNIKKNPFVEKVEIYSNLNGEVVIDVTQKVPNLRILNAQNRVFYVDSNAYKFPKSSNYAARVITASGYIRESGDTGIVKYDQTRELLKIASFINKKEFYRSLIGQIYVNKKKEIILSPRLGDIEIIFGNAVNIKEKFEKLSAFYQKVLPDNSWKTYRTINLKYKDQIIAKK